MTGLIMRVKYMDLPRQFEDGAVIARVVDEFKRCQFVLGPQVAEVLGGGIE